MKKLLLLLDVLRSCARVRQWHVLVEAEELRCCDIAKQSRCVAAGRLARSSSGFAVAGFTSGEQCGIQKTLFPFPDVCHESHAEEATVITSDQNRSTQLA